jgi:hypothetical protein
MMIFLEEHDFGRDEQTVKQNAAQVMLKRLVFELDLDGPTGILLVKDKNPVTALNNLVQQLTNPVYTYSKIVDSDSGIIHCPVRPQHGKMGAQSGGGDAKVHQTKDPQDSEVPRTNASKDSGKKRRRWRLQHLLWLAPAGRSHRHDWSDVCCLER